MISDSSIGKRIECGGHYGTIKFVGPVEGYQGIWLGIDWDDPERGKHNGTVNDVHYFDARYPTSGSFVRKEKVDFGQNLVDAIRCRYGSNEDEQTCKRNEQQLLKFQKDINAPFLQFVGFDKVANKQKNFQNLEVANVRSENVSRIELPTDLSNLCPSLQELDISKNLISSWTDVFRICAQLPRLHWINVSENLLTLPENYMDHQLPGITELICGNTRVTWADLMKLSFCFPNVQELKVPFNDITDLSTPPDQKFKKLRYLDLQGNNIGKWSEVLKLTVIQTLEHLNLEKVNLESIMFESPNIPVVQFNNLHTLNINDNKISEWRSIGELNKLRILENLRCLKNIVLEMEPVATGRQIIIAKLSKLKFLNGTFIRTQERKGAEYDYLKKYGIEWLHLQYDNEKKRRFLLEHNRYMDLIKKHGMPEQSELKVPSNIIAFTLLSVRLYYHGRITRKKIPSTLPIQKLITLYQKIFRIQSRPQLKRISGVNEEIVVLLNDEMKDMGYYSIQDGDIIQACCC